jgi:hypothetical protein
VVISTMRSLSYRGYMIYIVQDAFLDNVDSTGLLETYFLSQAYVISVDEAIRMMLKGTADPRGRDEFNLAL